MSISEKGTLSSIKTDVKTTNGMIRPGSFRVIAGPCTVESYEQFAASARAVKQAGYEYIRGGAFKPRTSPYSFQGLGEKGLKILSEVSKDLGLKAVTEVLDPSDIELVMEHAQILQIGTRNMANFALLKHVGAAIAGTDHGVVLKRGFSATVEESHHEPQEALCDAEQALPIEALLGLREVLQPFASAMGREVI